MAGAKRGSTTPAVREGARARDKNREREDAQTKRELDSQAAVTGSKLQS